LHLQPHYYHRRYLEALYKSFLSSRSTIPVTSTNRHKLPKAKMSFQVTEGSPIHSAGDYYHTGRGGAGNYRRLTSSTALSTAPLPVPPTSSSPVFFGGRGGAGNVKPKTERAMFSFDEELERDRLFHEHHAPVYSIGRGGAGNIVPSDAISTKSHYSGSGSPPSSPEASPRTSTSGSAPRFSSQAFRSSADKIWESLSRVRSS
jgi:hypothetical protein